MIEHKINIPTGIIFLGNYPELVSQLPQGSFIFNKIMTGCGATTMYLKDPIPTILCSPRREMIRCKATKDEFRGKIHLFGSEHPKGSVLDKINDMKGYVEKTLHTPFNPGVTGICKILVTYDSAKHVLQGLGELGCVTEFRVVVDEFQTLFTDAAFRGDKEAEFMENITTLGLPTVYLSATPYLKEYLKELPEFNTLPYIELVWPDSSKHHTNIVPTHYVRGSRSATMKVIIDHYRETGFFEEAMDDNGCIRRATQAVFFINDPKFIVNTIEANNLDLNDVNVICAECPTNEKILGKIGLTIGHAPDEGMPHATFTFVTKCSFEGTDFNHTNAFTYIFSDLPKKNMSVDISLDLPQIMGRQRLEENFFRYSARLFCRMIPEFDEQKKQEYMNNVQEKANETAEAVKDFESITDTRKRNREARKYRNSQKVEKYQNDYISVVDDIQEGQPKLTFNKYVMYNEIRSWFVHNDQFKDGTYVMNTISGVLSGATSEASKLANSFLSGFSGTFEECMKSYSEFLDQHPECKTDLQQSFQIPSNTKEYYNNLGSALLRSLSWKEANIKAYIAQQSSPCVDFRNIVKQTFLPGWYSLETLKSELQKLYDTYMPGMKAKGSDIERYCNCKKAKHTMQDGTRQNGYSIQ